VGGGGEPRPHGGWVKKNHTPKKTPGNFQGVGFVGGPPPTTLGKPQLKAVENVVCVRGPKKGPVCMVETEKLVFDRLPRSNLPPP